MVKKTLFKRLCLFFAAFFIFLYIGRVIYEFIAVERGYEQRQFAIINNTKSDSDISSVKNYASLKMEYENTAGGTAQVVDQKYEKIANISATTTKYDEEEKKLYRMIDQYKCVVQVENKQGLPGNRRNEMVIGVRPEYFDEAVESISKIGKVISRTETQQDKTAEYRQMLADKATLEKTKESYIALRQKGGSITELLALEEKIIEIEGKIQKQSVDLGEYSDDNAFCTINYTLKERTGAVGLGNIARILGNSLKWTAACYSAILGIITLTAVASLIILIVIKFGRQVLGSIFQSSETLSK